MFTKKSMFKTHKWKILSTLGILIFTLYSCEELLDEVMTERDEFYVDETEAYTAAQNLLFPEPFDADTTRRKLYADDYTQSKTIENLTPLYDEDDMAIMYIINYEEGGFVLLSADKRAEPVLARSNINDFPVEPSTLSRGLAMWMDEKKGYIQQLRKGEKSDSSQMTNYWEYLLETQVPVTFINFQFCGEDGFVMETILVQTQWGQGCGYNDGLPADCQGQGPCDRPLTGCVAVAMSQMMKYHADLGWDGAFEIDDALHLYDYSQMPEGNLPSVPSEDIPYLMRSMGTLADMSYGCDLSGASMDDAYDGFADNLGFHHTEFRDFSTSSDYDLMLNEFDNDRPVFLGGCDEMETKFFVLTFYTRCHAWLADGYSQRYNCRFEETGSFEIHMNWGWGGSADGYFLKKEGSYQYNREIMYNMYQDNYDYEW